jgi:hypothetical protein
MGIKFTMGLNQFYEEYKSFFINNLKTWPDTLDLAYSEAAKYNPKRAAAQSPGASERANAFTMSSRGGRGRDGHYPGGHNGRSTPNGYWARVETPERDQGEKGSTVAVYTASATAPHGYKRGPCNNCGKYGHLYKECRGELQHDQYGKEPANPKSTGGGKGTQPPNTGKGK